MASFSELLDKLGRGQSLNPLELAQLRDEVRAVEEVKNLFKSWVQAGTNTPVLQNPIIYNPDFKTSPLHVFHCVFSTNTSINNNTETLITFETAWGDNSVFDFYNGDESKIRIDRSQLNVRVDGMVAWEPNATGYRFLRMYIYDSSDVEILSQALHGFPGVAVAQNVLPISYTENIREIFPEVAYISFKVTQTSGAGLELQNFVLSVGVA